MKDHLRSHVWMHLGLLAAIAAVFVLTTVGVSVPTVVTYLIVAACPLMMIAMMVGMGAGHDGSAQPSDHEEHEGHTAGANPTVPDSAR
jgi:hypothetical protein